jgi:uncharacterized surface protein with fasciclin (FAS1) repeats
MVPTDCYHVKDGCPNPWTNPFLEDFDMTIQRRTLLLTATAGAAATLLAACGGGEDPQLQNLVQIAQADPQFSILVEAVQAAGLVDTLSTPGTYTVFAPTNTAFAALLTELGVTKAALLADTTLLTAVLKYHVLGSKVQAVDVPVGKAIESLQGGVFKIETSPSLAITDGRNRVSNITRTDVQASNGVLHVIDKVILPANKNIVETAQSISDFSILVEAVVAAGLVSTLSGTGPFTVFAPTNAAFAAALTELGVTKAQLLADNRLGDILKYHVVSGRVLKADVPVGTDIATVLGATETFQISAALAITDEVGRTSNITSTDVFASNGVVHVIDKVILPSAFVPT